ncbi:MAG: class I SAM-dependent RNA methyltransferase [Geminicoccaceae bacterium]
MSLAAGSLVELAILRLGSQGDGEADFDGQRVRLPLSLPGERWQARLVRRARDGWDAEPVTCLEGSSRAEPPCRHFGTCGGCRLQHLPAAAYTAFKVGRIRTALARRGLADVEIAEPLVSPPGSRRRLRLAWTRAGRRLLLGLRERRSHRLVDLAQCPVARPELVAALAPLRLFLAGESWAEGEASLTLTPQGLDLLLDLPKPPDAAARLRLTAFAAEAALARIACRSAGEPEPVVVPRRPMLDLDGTAVPLPPGSFLQATAEGEAALRIVVAGQVRKGDRVVDLFAGLGTFAVAALRAGAATVRAVEVDAAACAALTAARVPGIVAERRDLERRPLAGSELARTDLAILDPPRAGAADQVRLLGEARELERIAYVSCDPESFARDARTLVDAGFALERVQPVDQFLWSAEVELAAAFRRHSGIRRGRA